MARITKKRALEHLMDLLGVEGLSGQEKNVAQMVRAKLEAAGCPPSAIRHDRANRRIERASFEVGNLIVKLPGTAGRTREPRRLLAGHLDTVPLCRGAKPVVRGGRIVSAGETALGGDNRTAVAAWVSVLEAIFRKQLAHAPLTLLLTVGEEIGLLGAKAVAPKDLGNPKLGFNVDGGDPAKITIGAIGADRWEAHVYGRSAHAGVAPQDGVSAALIASRAIADVAQRGYFGKVRQGRREGTSNVGVLRGGEATNQVTDYVFVRGESRSHSEAFLKRITAAYRKAFERAARSVRSAAGESGRIELVIERDYDAFRMAKSAPPVKLAVRAATTLGLEPELVIANGGLDANCLNQKGIPTVTLGAGQHNPHTVDEYIDIREYVSGCQLLLALATG